ncbi:CBS domain-containing protein [Nocardioidaceae bacterium]|nr:CBS domain-containing protein [Nocardioidaceae bacterium]
MTALDAPTARVDDVMVTRAKTWPADMTVGEAAAAFTDHVHLLLLVRDGRLVGTVHREDLTPVAAPHEPVLDHARLEGRVVVSGTPLDRATAVLEARGTRRVAVVDEDDRLLGLLCLKRHRRGFCSDAGVAARAAERGDGDPDTGSRRPRGA